VKATLMYAAGDVRVHDVPDPAIQAPTDAIVRVTAAAICGSDLHPYRSMPPAGTGRRMGHEFVGIVEGVGTEVVGVKRGDLVLSSAATPAASAPAASNPTSHSSNPAPTTTPRSRTASTPRTSVSTATHPPRWTGSPAPPPAPPP
jgi:threonine dehydrogenase-like Zn-dependent dehydrogenase